MSVTSIMMVEEGFNQGIRCRSISEWFKMDFYVFSKEELLFKIGINNPDVVMIDLDLYEKMDGIETSRKIRSQFGVPVMYV
jgi:DNA-binding response OmpR family regulator